MRDARRFGASEEDIDAIRDELAPRHGDIGVWPENVATVEAFLAVATQWRTVALGGGCGLAGSGPSRMIFLGLDYAAARAGLDAAGIAVTPELWAGVRVMEDAARAALNEDRA